MDSAANERISVDLTCVFDERFLCGGVMTLSFPRELVGEEWLDDWEQWEQIERAQSCDCPVNSDEWTTSLELALELAAKGQSKMYVGQGWLDYLRQNCETALGEAALAAVEALQGDLSPSVVERVILTAETLLRPEAEGSAVGAVSGLAGRSVDPADDSVSNGVLDSTPEYWFAKLLERARLLRAALDEPEPAGPAI